MYLENCLVRTWSGGGQSVAETWSGGGQSVAETCTSRARHVSDNRDHYTGIEIRNFDSSPESA